MNSVRPTVETLLADAVEIASWEARQAFIADACAGDDALRREVDRLVACHFAAGSFLEHTAGKSPTIPFTDVGEAPGAQIGPYKLLEQIGEGGFGVVFMADQSVPIRRRVALKMLKPGMDTRQVIARFEAERQALALMDYPHIAKVLDAGATEAGRPYFVMELVKGIPITRFSDEQRLSMRERLALFIDVCGAIQHAHQNGIIHRDIKPTNVLVTLRDGQPIVKVIDFGVAKAVGQQLTEKTIFTGFAQMVGTPLYMSPEQAALSAVDVDARSDVYCLGVLLYELLTGTTPFTKETLTTAGYDEMRRIIREDDPPRPSTRLSTLDVAKLSTILQQRQLDPKRFHREIRGELDWIAMKALEKVRERRYQSASALAEDLMRFLNNQPVAACPPSAMYTLRKFIQRHRLLLITTACIVVALITGMTVATWQTVVASFERLRAQTAEDGHRQQTDKAENLLYAAEMRLASRHWQAGDDDQTDILLDHWIPPAGKPDRRGLEWRLLKRRQRVRGEELMFLSGPSTTDGSLTNDVSCLRVDTQRNVVFAATDGGRIHRYDLIARTQLSPWETGLEDVRRLELSPDGRWLAAISYPGEVAVLNRKDGILQQRFPKPAAPLGEADIAFDDRGDFLISTGSGSQVRLWDLKRIESPPRTWTISESKIIACCSIPQRSMVALVVEADGHSLVFHKLHDGRRVGRFGLEFSTVCMAASPDGQYIALGGLEGWVVVWEWGPAIRLAKFAVTEKVSALAFSADGEQLAVADKTGTVHVWNWRQYPAPELVDAHQDVAAPAPPIDSSGANLRNRQGSTQHTSHQHWRAHPRPARSVAFDPDQKHVISAGIDGRIMRWSCDDAAGRYASLFPSPSSVAWITDRNALAVLDQHALSLIDRKLWTSDIVEKPTAPRRGTSYCASNGRWLAWSTSPGRLMCWDPLNQTTPAALLEAESPTGELSLVEFLPNTPQLVTVSADPDMHLRIWDVEKRVLLMNKKFDRELHGRRALAGSSQTLFTFHDHVLSAIDLRSGKLRCEWEFGSADVDCLTATSSGDKIAVGFSNRRIELVNGSTGMSDQTFVGHLGLFRQLQFTPDGKTLLALDSRGELKFWQVSLGAELFSWPMRKPIRWFSISPDSQSLLLGYDDGLELVETAPLAELP